MRFARAQVVSLLLVGCPPSGPVTGGGAMDAGPGRVAYVHENQGPVSVDDRELPVNVVKDFTCDPAAVGDRMTVAEMLGAPGELVAIEPADAECHYNLVYRTGSERTALSSEPGGYLLTAARRFPDGVRGVCSSDIVHSAGSDGVRTMSQVLIRCWASATTSFGASVVAVTPDGDWAAWVRNLVPVQGRAGVFILEWTRDSSFQFLTLSDEGRPESDGVFRTELTFDGTALTVGATTRVSSRTNPFADAPTEPWTPTPEDLRRLEGQRP